MVAAPTGRWANLAVPLVCAWSTPDGNTGVAPTLSSLVQRYGLSVVAGIVVAGGLMLIASGAARFAIGRQLSAAEILPSDACFRQLQGARLVSLADGAIARVLSFKSPEYRSFNCINRECEDDRRDECTDHSE
jgi:hypothetical protein